jgi:hypothetical protein
MFDAYAAALATVQLPEGTNVVPPRAGAGSSTTAASNPPAIVGCMAPLVDHFDFGRSARSAAITLQACNRT